MSHEKLLLVLKLLLSLVTLEIEGQVECVALWDTIPCNVHCLCTYFSKYTVKCIASIFKYILSYICSY